MSIVMESSARMDFRGAFLGITNKEPWAVNALQIYYLKALTAVRLVTDRSLRAYSTL
jgi:hypothetical protein